MKFAKERAHREQNKKASYPEEKLQNWKEHFTSLLVNPSENTEKSIKKSLMVNYTSNYDNLERKDSTQNRKKLKLENPQLRRKYSVEFER